MNTVLAAAVVAGGAWYAIACWLYPLADCWCCGGSGAHRSKGRKGRRGKTSRRCRTCGGKGRWFRVGVRAWHWFRGSEP